MERERAVYKEKEDALKVTLDKMKIAWTKREAEWQVCHVIIIVAHWS